MAAVKPFQAPLPWRGARQFATTFLLYLAVVAAMYAALPVSVWLTLVNAG